CAKDRTDVNTVPFDYW
nr:immunoglobulin heavy chain junction region [Macaca mulatta]